MLFRSTILTLYLVASFTLFGADEEVVDADTQSEYLTLEEALSSALENNLGLITERYASANAQDDIVAEEAAFDVELFGNVNLRERQSAAIGSTSDSAVPASENRRVSAGVTKQLSTGASVTIDSGLNRSTNNSPRNPDYASDVGLSLRQPLLKDSGTRVNLAPLARARVQATRSLFSLRSDVLDVILNTETAYWNLAYARASRKLIVSSLELAQNLLEENRERERLGMVTPLEVLQAETELVNQQENIIQAERAIEDASDQLRQLMGKTSFLETIEGSIEVDALPREIPTLPTKQQVVRDAITQDTEVATQELQIEVQKINRLLAADENRMDLDFVGGVNYLGSKTDGPSAYEGAFNADGYDWNVGVELRVPFGLRDAKARVRQATRDLEREKVRLFSIKQEQALSARNAWRALYAGVQRIEVTSKALSLNEEAFKQERARYGSGLSAYRRVLEAQRDFDQAKRNYLDSIIETIRASIRLGRIDGSILSRNGFSWDTLDSLAREPDVESHPLLKTTFK